jgi:hypothetical protein
MNNKNILPLYNAAKIFFIFILVIVFILHLCGTDYVRYVYYSVDISEEFYKDSSIDREIFSDFRYEDMLFLAGAKNCSHEDVCIFASVYSDKLVKDSGKLEKVDIFSENNILMERYLNKDIHMGKMHTNPKGIYKESYTLVVPQTILEEYRIHNKPVFVRIFFEKNDNKKIFYYQLKMEMVGEIVFPT